MDQEARIGKLVLGDFEENAEKFRFPPSRHFQNRIVGSYKISAFTFDVTFYVAKIHQVGVVNSKEVQLIQLVFIFLHRFC